MHHFEKMSPCFAPDPTGPLPLDTAWGFRPSDPLIAHPVKNPAGRGRPTCLNISGVTAESGALKQQRTGEQVTTAIANRSRALDRNLLQP